MAKSSKKKPAKAKAPRRRKLKETKAEAVEVSSGVQLLLGNIIGQKDREYYLETFLKLKAKAATANSAVRDFRKKAKEAGVNMSAVDDVLAMEKMDPMDLADLLKQTMLLARDRGLPVQIQLFEPKYGSPDEQATKLFWDAGINGRSPPIDLFPEGAPGYEAGMRAWNDAQKQIVEDGKKAQE